MLFTLYRDIQWFRLSFTHLATVSLTSCFPFWFNTPSYHLATTAWKPDSNTGLSTRSSFDDDSYLYLNALGRIRTNGQVLHHIGRRNPRFNFICCPIFISTNHLAHGNGLEVIDTHVTTAERNRHTVSCNLLPISNAVPNLLLSEVFSPP